MDKFKRGSLEPVDSRIDPSKCLSVGLTIVYLTTLLAAIGMSVYYFFSETQLTSSLEKVVRTATIRRGQLRYTGTLMCTRVWTRTWTRMWTLIWTQMWTLIWTRVWTLIWTRMWTLMWTLMWTYDGNAAFRFVSIPLTKPPVGDLRFRPPERLGDDPTVSKTKQTYYNATKLKKSCWSITKKVTSPYYSEDCLYLNVYVPHTHQGNFSHTEGFPVVVWIHGGGFVAGSVFPEPYQLVTRGQVIVVTINYRLGAFGFLTTQDNLLPANNGLWDQVYAMMWVKEHIESFGGDSNSISIFGESAGAMSAALHAISPASSHLFNRALMQSGAASSLIRRNPIKIATQFGNNTGCGDEVSIEFSDCIRNLSVETILKYSDSFDIPEAGKQADFIWMPTIDKDLIPDEPGKLLNNVSYLKSIDAFDKDYLFGLNNNDGSLAISNFMHPISTNRTFDINFFETFTNHLLTLTHDIPTAALKNVADAITSFYVGSIISHSASGQMNIKKETIMDLMVDAMFFAPVSKMASAMSGCYEDRALQVCDSNARNRQECVDAVDRSFVYVSDVCPPLYGCRLPCITHGSNIGYLIPTKKFPNVVDELILISDDLIGLLSHFITTGQPGLGIPAYAMNLQLYIGVTLFSATKQYFHFHPYRMNLWLSEIPELADISETIKRNEEMNKIYIMSS